MTATHLFELRCEAEDCEHRFVCRELTVNNARGMARPNGWSAKGRKDFCPDHPPS